MAVLRIENISKKYVLNNKGKSNDDLRDTLTGWSKKIFKPGGKEEKTDFWALKDISFEVQQGDRLGLVGANGAGKSTLLKILSQITAPTTGSVKIKGRMASLLEVGTGFHPELTGRENIFLKENQVFIDTPVKRYSSGMYVRLGFAIAAHLEPEILVVDEVLAVGDADFQKKSIVKMKDVSNSGRTLLFVSHNLTAVQGLCNNGAYLRGGEMMKFGPIDEVITEYVKHVSKFNLAQDWANPNDAPGNDFVRIKSIRLVPDESHTRPNLDTTTPLRFEMEYWNYVDQAELNISIFLYSMTGECVFNIGDEAKFYQRGTVKSICEIPGDFLNDGSYYMSVMIVRDRLAPVFFFEDALAFDIIDYREGTEWVGKWPGAVRPKMIEVKSWQTELL